MTIQLKIVIFYEKRLLLNVEENQPMASLIYVKLSFYKKHFAAQYHFPLVNLGQEWKIFRNLHIGNFCFFAFFKLSLHYVAIILF
jgi:hypothetical protein